MIDILHSKKKKKLYCCFIDFKQAFDNVWRVGLWHKLIQDGVRGKYFALIKNLYKTVKSKVSTPDGNSEFFECYNGVIQGKNLSHFPFSIFLNDLEYFLNSRQINGVKIDFYSEETTIFMNNF